MDTVVFYSRQLSDVQYQQKNEDRKHARKSTSSQAFRRQLAPSAVLELDSETEEDVVAHVPAPVNLPKNKKPNKSWSARRK